MPAATGNPNVSKTAAQHIVDAMRRVHPRQRAEVLRDLIAHAQAALAHIESGERRAA